VTFFFHENKSVIATGPLMEKKQSPLQNRIKKVKKRLKTGRKRLKRDHFYQLLLAFFFVLEEPRGFRFTLMGGV